MVFNTHYPNTNSPKQHPNAEFCSDVSDIADGYCHDMSNTVSGSLFVIIADNLDDDAFFFDTKQPICDFDGGDCCLADMKVNFCIRCSCVNDMNYTTTEISMFTGYDIGTMNFSTVL